MYKDADRCGFLRSASDKNPAGSTGASLRRKLMKRSLPLRGESTNAGIKGEANHLDAATCMCDYRLFFWETHVWFTLVRRNQPDVAG